MDEFACAPGVWSHAVKELSGTVCAICGCSEHLEAHHIVPYSRDESLARDLSNGVCLCHHCHYLAHNRSFCDVGRENRLGHRLPPRDKECAEVFEYLDKLVVLLVPKGQKATVERAAQAAGESVNLYTQKALLSRMGLDSWPELSDDLPQE